MQLCLLAINKVLYFFGCFIIHLVYFRIEPTPFTVRIYFFACSQQLFFITDIDCYTLDKICILDVNNADVFHALIEFSWHHACLVACNKPSEFWVVMNTTCVFSLPVVCSRTAIASFIATPHAVTSLLGWLLLDLFLVDHTPCCTCFMCPISVPS